MKVEPLGPFLCPLDGDPLQTDGASLVCANRHRYDRAREGYVNLLPVQSKASRDPGDDKAMVAARSRNADAGLFNPLSEALFEWLREFARQGDLRVLDAGCGEGYALADIQRRAAQCADPATLRLAGYDISKWAVRAAARRAPTLAWSVASNRQPPFATGSVDVLLSLFGFAHWPAFESLLAPAGRLVTVDAEATHLLELREIVYPEVTMGTTLPAAEALQRGWQLVRTQVLAWRVHLATPAAIDDVLAMTPHAHRITASGRAALAERTQLTLTMNVAMREWRPPPRD